jgi:hypothetical protein
MPIFSAFTLPPLSPIRRRHFDDAAAIFACRCQIFSLRDTIFADFVDFSCRAPLIFVSIRAHFAADHDFRRSGASASPRAHAGAIARYFHTPAIIEPLPPPPLTPLTPLFSAFIAFRFRHEPRFSRRLYQFSFALSLMTADTDAFDTPFRHFAAAIDYYARAMPPRRRRHLRFISRTARLPAIRH